MNIKKRFDIYHILSLAFLCILPVIAIIKGIGLVVKNGMILTSSFIFTFFALPLIAILLFFIILVKVKKTWAKVVMCIVVLLASLFCFVGFCGFQKYEIVNHYENEEVQVHYAENSNELMPRLSELSNPQKVDYYHYEGEGFIFLWQSDSLICKYSDEEYLEQKASLEEKYVFQTDVIKWDEHICEPTIEIDGYSFRMLSRNEYEMDYPKDVVFIATNDETREIVYVCYNDQDRDYIESVEEFILDECGWKHIR